MLSGGRAEWCRGVVNSVIELVVVSGQFFYIICTCYNFR